MECAFVRVFFPSPSLFITVLSLAGAGSLATLGLSEVRGKHLQYSKFWSVGKPITNQKKVSSRTGMLIGYTPAFLAAAASFLLFPGVDVRLLLVKSVLTIHFFKRILEVLFVHKYSGWMALDTAITMCLSYFSLTALKIYVQYLSQGLPEPAIDLKGLGIWLFLIGISGNFYHHYLLSRTRSRNDREYKIPKGGLFNLVTCPHYLFEILDFWGIAFISQTLYAFCIAIGITFYLMGRSQATWRWYQSKFEDFPKGTKALIPFIF